MKEQRGTSPIVEIFPDRIKFYNAGEYNFYRRGL